MGSPENDELVINNFGEWAASDVCMDNLLYLADCVSGRYLLWATLTSRYRHAFRHCTTASRGPQSTR